MKKVSVYIPCFNAEKHIEGCIKSVLRQTYPIDEILIIDDGCSDKTIEKTSKYSVKIFRNKENKGLAFSRNKGILKAKNEFVASIDADVILDKKWLENLMKDFTSDKMAGVCGNLEENYKKRTADLWRLIHMNQNWGKKKIINPKFLFGSNCVFRKNAVKDVDLYNIKYRTNYEDVDISNRLKTKGYKLIYEPNAKAIHLKQDSITSVLKSSWNWTLFSYNPSANLWGFFLRLFTDAYKSLTYLLEDIINLRLKFVFLDLLVFPSHIIFNLRYLVKSMYTLERWGQRFNKWQNKLFYQMKVINMKKKFDILFVTCPFFGASNPPIGVAYICEYLKKERFKVGVYDLSIKIFNSLNTEFKNKWINMKIDYSDDKEIFKLISFSKEIINEFLVYLSKKNVRIIAFSILRSNRIFSYYVASEIKKRFNDKIIIFGGVGVFLPQERAVLSKECPNIDKVVDIFVKGEGEIITKEIIENLKNKKLFWRSLREIKGMVYTNNKNMIKINSRKNNNYIDTGKPEKILDLGNLPYPRYKEFNLDEYVQKTIPIIFGKGCIKRCSFCVDRIYLNGYAERSAHKVFEEILYHIKKNKISIFEFNDLAFNINLEKIRRFCDLIIKYRIKILWNCNCFVREDMSFELFKKMKEAGCKIIRTGIESGSDRMLKLMNKNYTSKQASEMLKKAHNAGLETNINIIVGFPGEVEKDLKKTLYFIKNNKNYIDKILNVTCGSITPNTDLEKNPHKYGIITNSKGFIMPKGKHAHLWKDKFGNNCKERERKLLIVKDLVNSLKIPVFSLNK